MTLTNQYGTLNIAAGATKADTAPYWMVGNVGGHGAGFYINLRSGFNGSGGGDAPAYRIQYGGTDTGATISSHTWTIGQTSTGAMTLDVNSNLLLGTTSGTQRLVVSNNASGAYVARFSNTTGSNANGVYIDTPNRAGDGGLFGLTVANSGGNAFAIYTNGTYGTISDINRKKNVETARNGYLTDLCALRVVKYNWNEQEDNEPKELGFIAQEIEQVFAGLVQADDNGQKMVKQPVLIPMLVKALQEAVAEINSLKARLDAANL
jgi:hypothetical protein